MKFISTIILVGAIIGFHQTLLAEDFKGLVQISSGRKLYVDWKKAQPGKDTLVLVNGLTSEETSWDLFVLAFAPTGYGILRYDPKGMGLTLAHDGPVKAEIKMQDQANDLDLLTNKLGLTGKLNLLGHSYGGGLITAFAQFHSDRINKAILLCPYTEPLAGADSMIRQQIQATRFSFPFNPASDAELYAYFLREDIYTVFPATDPSILISPLKPEAVFQLTQGIRVFNMKKASQYFPANSVNLVIAGSDEYIQPLVLDNFWKQLPEDVRASKALIDFTMHRVPEIYPTVLATWAQKIMDQPAGALRGRSFEVNPISGSITQH